MIVCLFRPWYNLLHDLTFLEVCKKLKKLTQYGIKNQRVCIYNDLYLHLLPFRRIAKNVNE